MNGRADGSMNDAHMRQQKENGGDNSGKAKGTTGFGAIKIILSEDEMFDSWNKADRARKTKSLGALVIMYIHLTNIKTTTSHGFESQAKFRKARHEKVNQFTANHVRTIYVV